MIAASPNCRSRSISRTRLLVFGREVGREVRREHRLAGAALRREHGDHLAAAACAVVRRRQRDRRPGRPCGSRTRSSRAAAAGRGHRRRLPRGRPRRARTRLGGEQDDRRRRVPADLCHVARERRGDVLARRPARGARSAGRRGAQGRGAGRPRRSDRPPCPAPRIRCQAPRGPRAALRCPSKRPRQGDVERRPSGCRGAWSSLRAAVHHSREGRRSTVRCPSAS